MTSARIRLRPIALLALIALLAGASGPSAHADGPDDWAALTVAELADAAADLVSQPGTEEDVQLLAVHAADRYAALKAAGDPVDWTVWRRLAALVGRQCPDEARKEMAQDLRSALVPDAAAAAALPAGDLLETAEALKALGAGSAAAEACAAWVTGSDAYATTEPAALGQIGLYLDGAAETVQAARQRLAADVEAAHLADAAATRAVSPQVWRHWVMAIRGSLSAEERQAWATKLRQAFADDPAVLAGLESWDTYALVDAARRLGFGQEVALKVLTGSDAWQERSPSTVRQMCGPLPKEADAPADVRAARARVGEWMTARYVEGETPPRADQLGDLKALVDRVGMDFSAETRGAWVAKLRSTFAADVPSFGSLETGQKEALVAMLAGLGDGEAPELWWQWIEGAAPLPSMGARDTGNLCRSLLRAGGADAQGRFVQHLADRYLSNPASTRSLAPGQWQALTHRLRKGLPDDVKAAWADALWGAFTGPSALGELELADLEPLAKALWHLGRGGSDVLRTRWVEASDKWQEMSPGTIRSLAKSARKAEGAGAAARARMVEHLGEEVLASPAATRTFSCEVWEDLAKSLVRDVPPEARARWAERLREAFVEDGSTLAALKPSDLFDLSSALGRLGDKPGDDVLVPYVLETKAWHDSDPHRLGEIVGRLDKLGAIGRKALAHVANHIAATCLADTATVRGVGLGRWDGLTPAARALSSEDREAWAQMLRTAFAPDAASLLDLGPEHARQLVGAIRHFDRQQADNLALDWFTGAAAEKTLADGADRLGRAALTAPRATAEQKAAIAATLEAQAAGDGPVGFYGCVRIARLWRIAEDWAKARTWFLEAYEAAVGTPEGRQTVSMAVLNDLARYLYDYDLTYEYHGRPVETVAFPAFAEAAARHAREGSLSPRSPAKMATLLASPADRAVVRAELVDAGGAPRLPVAKLLAYAHRDVGESADWRTFLKQQLDAATDPDSRALWLSALGYAEVLAQDPPDPLARRRRLDEALAVAETEPVRFVVIEELVSVYRQLGRPGEAADLVASLRDQFGAAFGPKLADLEEDLRSAQAARRAGEERTQAAAEVSRKRWRLGYYRRCLEGARARGDAEAAADLERSIAELEEELNP